MPNVDNIQLRIGDIGLKQGRKLAAMKHADRLAFVSEGLPMIAESAQGYWSAASALPDCPREAEVLVRHAEEEAAKALILIDIVRCPTKLVADRAGKLMGWFYSHLARLIWADMCGSCVVDGAEIQSYVDLERRSHFLDGPTGADWIYSNSKLHRREAQLYVDVEGGDDGRLRWSKPDDSLGLSIFQPPSLQAMEGLMHLGVFGADGIRILAEIWSAQEFTLGTDHKEDERLTQAMLEALMAGGHFLSTATDTHVQALYRSWPMPMYNLDFSPIAVPIEDLRAYQDGSLASLD